MKKSIGSGRGSVYNIILKTLQSGDKYGYEICKEVEEKTDGVYILKQPSLYSGLKRLEAQGEISSYWRDSALGGRRHYYSLTEKGRDRIEQSNFNWQDARDEIIGSLFEKSELDKTIESAQKDVEDIKTISEKNSSYEKDIDEILESTKDLFDFGNKEADSHTDENSFETEDADAKNYDNSENVEKITPKTEQESENAETSNDFGDLFSMFKTVEQADEDEVKQNVLDSKTNDDLIDDEQLDSSDTSKQEEIVETKNEEKTKIKEAEHTEQFVFIHHKWWAWI